MNAVIDLVIKVAKAAAPVVIDVLATALKNRINPI